jgi:hypothetical protein
MRAVDIDYDFANERRRVLTTQEIIHDKINFESLGPNPEKKEFYFTLQIAWDALAYRRYPVRSGAGLKADSLLRAYSGLNIYTGEHSRERTVTLNQEQVRLLDAFAEVADIPHERGQAEIPLPFADIRERNTILRRAAQREYEEYQRGEAEGGISDAELGRRHKAVSEQAEREWREYSQRPSHSDPTHR